MASRLAIASDSDRSERKPVYERVAMQIIADMERPMCLPSAPENEPPEFGVDIKLLISQMINELADHRRSAQPAPKVGAGFAAEEFFRSTGARFRYDGDWPHYDAEEDVIYFPRAESFRLEEDRIADKARELVHWTGHKTRLNRNYGSLKYGTEGYSREMLAGEFGTAFLCTLLQITPELCKFHAANIAGWLRAIGTNRSSALWLAIKDAEVAVDYLYFLRKQIALVNSDKR